MARPVTWRWLITGFLLGALIVGVPIWWLQPVVPSLEAQAALADWLNTSCTAGENPQKEDDLRRFGTELERAMISLYEVGPSQRERERVEAAARTQFERTRVLISSGTPTYLPAADVQALLAASVDQWAQRAGEDFVSSRRAAALVALGITGSRKGRRLLESVAAEPTSPYRAVARSAIAAPVNP
jgi:hypothetical protein